MVVIIYPDRLVTGAASHCQPTKVRVSESVCGKTVTQAASHGTEGMPAAIEICMYVGQDGGQVLSSRNVAIMISLEITSTDR